ncbi:unnamed protein product [Allacma fusca]|uniref:Aldehyde dehydrogenase domain-containing protein n=1 Tax=Allacma fusca TaxID=39272 RepID=A0A8J2LSX1_9HEXA|nr:unnamed protein product [Allacma fusca]
MLVVVLLWGYGAGTLTLRTGIASQIQYSKIARLEIGAVDLWLWLVDVVKRLYSHIVSGSGVFILNKVIRKFAVDNKNTYLFCLLKKCLGYLRGPSIRNNSVYFIYWGLVVKNFHLRRKNKLTQAPLSLKMSGTQELILKAARAADTGTIYELEVVKAEAISVLKHLKEYASKEHLPINVLGDLDRGYILREPYGLVLILGAWNYLFTLTFKPLIGVIAAGNCVVIKPSEVSAESASIMAKLLPKYFDPVCYPVVLADVDES